MATPSHHRATSFRTTALLLALGAGAALSGCSRTSSRSIQPAPNPDPTLRPVAITVTSPADGQLMGDREIDILGQTTSVTGPAEVDIAGFRTTVAADGSFALTGFPMVDGANPLTAVLLQNGSAAASTSLTVLYEQPSEASAAVDPNTPATLLVTSGPLTGAGLDVPVGAAQRAMRVRIEHDPEHTPNLGFGFAPLGPPVVFAPLGEVFDQAVSITLPFDPNALPPGTGVQDVVILGFDDSRWQPVAVSSRSGSSVTAQVTDFVPSSYRAVVQLPLRSDQLRVTTVPAGATIYIDGGATGFTTPATLSSIAEGNREIKLYLPGYDEVFQSVVQPATGVGTTLDVNLQPTAATAPTVQLPNFIQNGLQAPASLFKIDGIVSEQGAPVTGGFVVIALNGLDTVDVIRQDGSFSAFVSLLPGRNELQVRANGATGQTGATSIIEVNFSPSTDMGTENFITATLTWNTADTDVDIHVFDPQGNHAWFGAPSGQQGGIPGAMIDRDDIGFGPEIFTFPEPGPGSYRVAVDYYSDRGNGPTTATLTISVGTTQIFSDSYRLTQSDLNATNGSPVGANPAAFWDAHTFEISDFKIVSVTTPQGGDRNGARFTTDPLENSIDIQVEAPATINNSQIEFEIIERNEGFTVDTTGVTGRMATAYLTHRPLTGLTSPRFSQPLQYQIVASYFDGTNTVQSDPFILEQDTPSQIRQEFIDKALFAGSFARSVPTYGEVVTASTLVAPADFPFSEFARYSDFGPNVATVNDAATIAQTIRDAWGHPIRITSAWRNPRRNDSFDGADINSFHQTGNAVDINPSTNAADWPPGTTTYAEAQRSLIAAVRSTLDLEAYDTMFHGDHIHIEADPTGPSNR